MVAEDLKLSSESKRELKKQKRSRKAHRRCLFLYGPVKKAIEKAFQYLKSANYLLLKTARTKGVQTQWKLSPMILKDSIQSFKKRSKNFLFQTKRGEKVPLIRNFLLEIKKFQKIFIILRA